MPTVRCGQRITAAKLVVSGVGYGTLANAKKNAYRDALNRVLPFMGRERMRWRCERRCPGIVEWRQRVRYGPAVAQPKNTVRITCELTLRLAVDCRGGGELAMLQHQYIGEFADEGDAIQSQAAAVPPAGGGKSGVFFADEKFAATLSREKGYYYIIYLPGSAAEGDVLEIGDAITLTDIGEGEAPEEAVETVVFDDFGDDLIGDDDL